MPSFVMLMGGLLVVGRQGWGGVGVVMVTKAEELVTAVAMVV